MMHFDQERPTDSKTDSTLAYYARRATEYERIYSKPERQEDLKKLKSRLQELYRGHRVFELACGTGYWTQVLAGSAASIHAVDLSEETLAVAQAKRLDSSMVSFDKADAYRLPALPTGLTAAFSGFWWSHIPRARIREFLVGFHRRLPPNVSVVFVDNRYVEGSSTPIARSDPGGDTYQVRQLQDGTTYEVLKNFPTERELLSAVEGISTDVQVELSQYYWLLRYKTPSTRH